jgi:hypothetical protein
MSDPINDPLDAEFWWQAHERAVREGLVDTPFRRNPNDIKEALGLTEEARQPILEAHRAATRFYNINQCQRAAETLAYTMIAKLLDAGILTRLTPEQKAILEDAAEHQEFREGLRDRSRNRKG